jgi:hypothetical protein
MAVGIGKIISAEGKVLRFCGIAVLRRDPRRRAPNDSTQPRKALTWALTFLSSPINRNTAIPQYCNTAILALVALIGGISCSGPSFNFEGHWVGKRNLPKKPGDNDTILNTIAKVDLRLLPTGRFELFEGGVPKAGTYRTSGETAYLSVTTFMDRPIEEQGSAAVAMNKEVQLKSQKDGSIIFSDPAGLWQEPVTLVREKEEAQPKG